MKLLVSIRVCYRKLRFVLAILLSAYIISCNANILQSRRRSLTKKGKDDSDSGWSDNENEPSQAPPVAKPTTQRTGSFKPAISKPPEHSKPPPAAVKTNPLTLGRKSSIEGSHGSAENVDLEDSPSAPTTGVFSREAELESQLEKTHSELIAARREKTALEKSVVELQDRLTMAETSGSSSIMLSQDKIGTLEANIRRGEREKDLEKQLVKVKKEKDKALRLVISLIGKVLSLMNYIFFSLS